MNSTTLYSFTLARVIYSDSSVKMPAVQCVCVCVYKWVEQCGLGSSNLLVLYFLPFLSFKWFWGSIQMDARAGESMYSYEKVTQRTCKKVVYHLYFRYNILNIIQLTISSDSYCYLLYFCFMCLMQIFI